MEKYVITPTDNLHSKDGAVFPRFNVAHFLKRCGYEKIPLNMFNGHEPGSKNYQDIINSYPANSLIVHQIPTYCGQLFDYSFPRSLKSKGNINVALVHDVDTLRGFNDDINDIVNTFNQYDLLVVASQRLIDYLVKHGIQTKIISRGPWDYFSKTISNSKPEAAFPVINYAGNLTSKKAGFLEGISLKIGFPVNVWGQANPPEPISVNGYTYMGSSEPDQLNIKRGWGLVWDGAKEPGNFYHDYQYYNWAAKIGLYLRNALPLIVDEKANSAEYVLDKNIGITINKLEDIKKINDLTDYDLNNIRTNTYYESKKIADGYYDQEMAANIEKVFNIV